MSGALRTGDGLAYRHLGCHKAARVVKRTVTKGATLHDEPALQYAPMAPKDYWAKVCVPKLRERKEQLGRNFTNDSISEEVERLSGKRTGRTLFQHFLRGRREPYLSQALAICKVMGIEPGEFFSHAATQQAATARAVPVFQSQDGTQRNKKQYKKQRPRTAG